MSSFDEFIYTNNTKVTTVSFFSKYSLFQKNARLWMILVLVLSDIMILFFTSLIVSNLRFSLFDDFNKYYYYDFLWIPIFFLIALFSISGLYPGLGLSEVEEIRRLSLSTTLMFLLIITFTFLLKTTEIYSRVVIIFTWLISLFTFPASRIFIRHICIRFKIWGEPVAIIGDPAKALPLARFFKNRPRFGILPSSVFCDNNCSSPDFKKFEPMTVEEIISRAHNLSLKTALIVVDDLNDMDDLVDRYRYAFQRVILIKYQKGRYGLLNLKTMDFSDVMGLEVKHNLLDQNTQIFKRIFDILVSLYCLVCLTPVFVIISILIRIDSPGKIYYFSPRIGRKNQIFNMIKFRTMHINADKVLQDKLEKDPNLKKEWDQFQKLVNDPRMTRVGKFLRKFSLDELPQILNVLKGEMSLVGPRPIMPFQDKKYGEPIKDYIQVAPGITGLWQISGRNNTTYMRHVDLDLEYIQRWSIWLDFYIILKTIKIVLSQDGAY